MIYVRVSLSTEEGYVPSGAVFVAQVLQSQLTLKLCFPVNFVKFLRTPFFTEHLWWLLLKVLFLLCIFFRNGYILYETSGLAIKLLKFFGEPINVRTPFNDINF